MYLFDVAYYFCFITTFVVENNTVFAKTQIFLTPFMVIVQTSSACRDLAAYSAAEYQQFCTITFIYINVNVMLVFFFIGYSI